MRKQRGREPVDVALRVEEGDSLGEGRVSDEQAAGFDVSRARDGTRLHIGLDSVAERLRLAGGALEIQSEPGTRRGRLQRPRSERG